MTKLSRVAGTALALTVLALGLTTEAPAGEAAQPTIILGTTSLVPGQFVAVHGDGWPANTDVQLQLCGRNAIEGSADCALESSLTVSAGVTGQIDGQLLVEMPPKPCPCVVLVQTLSGIFSASIPVAVAGAPVEAVTPAPAAKLEVKARVVGGGTLGSFFGLSAHRMLVLTIINRSLQVATYPVVSAGWGRSAGDLSAISAPAAPALQPGQRIELRLPFELSPFSFGSYRVQGKVSGGTADSEFRASAATIPWGLLILAAAMLQGFLLLLRNRLRARLGRGTPPEPSVEEQQIHGEVESVEVIDPDVPPSHPAKVTDAATDATTPVEVVQLGQHSLQSAIAGGAADRLGETVDAIDLRPPSAQLAHVWTTTHRLALLFARQGLTCTVEVLVCPAVKLQRTRIRAWADFALSSWDALHEGSVWADLATDSVPNTLAPGDTFIYDGKGLRLEMQLDAIGPELAVGRKRTVVPVRVRGSASFGDELSTVLDMESVLEKTWASDDSEDNSAVASEPTGGSITYARAPRGDSFYLQLDADGEPAGWLVRNGHPSPIVHAERRVEERAGPYPRRVVVELTDDLGRRSLADGTAHKGMASKEEQHLTLECRLYWNLDGVAAAGEDRSEIDLDAWRSATRAAFYAMANQNGASATVDHAPAMAPVSPAEYLDLLTDLWVVE